MEESLFGFPVCQSAPSRYRVELVVLVALVERVADWGAAAEERVE